MIVDRKSELINRADKIEMSIDLVVEFKLEDQLFLSII
jgi:hypothetical protein